MKKILVIPSQRELIRSLLKSNEYYVYIHYNLQSMQSIYIGSGTKYRLLQSTPRNKKWCKLFKTVNIGVKVYKHKLSLIESRKVEADLIEKIGLSNLLNCIKGQIEIGSGIPLYNKYNGNFGNKGKSNPLSISVACLDFNGKLIKVYNSLKETTEDGFIASCVSSCCCLQRKQHKQHQFLYYKDYDSNKEYIYVRSKTSIRSVKQYSKDLKLIRTYSSINSTTLYGFNPKNVQQVCKGHKKSHFGYIFKYST